MSATDGRLLTAREIAERLVVSTETVLRWHRRGDLPGVRLPGGAIRFREDKFEEWLEERATPRRGVLATTPGAARARTLRSPALATTEGEE
jgi:excisionase family DNA binding protein